MKAPCKNCNDREVGCHASCERYLEAKRENDERLAKIYAAKQEERLVNDYISDRKPKIIRQAKRKNK